MAIGSCETCRQPIRSPWDAIEVRQEYRRLAKLSRERTWRLRLVCRVRAEKEYAAHHNPSGAEQGALL